MKSRRLSTTVLLGVGALLLLWLAVAPTVGAQDPGPESDGRDCWACHRQPTLAGLDGTRASIAMCLDCHGDPQVDEWARAGRTPVYVNGARYADTLHGQIACVACHTDVARNPHRAESPVACADCHAVILSHVNMGAPHLSTDCAACHRSDLPVVRNDETGRLEVARVDAAGNPLDRTAHALTTDVTCTACHVPGNDVGAPAVALPARGLLCMPCHDAAPIVSVGVGASSSRVTDYGSIVGLLILAVGMTVNFSLYLRGEIPGHPGLTAMQKLSYIVEEGVRLLFSRRIFRLAWGLVAEGIFLRRVLRESVGRWVMHSLIYLPFLARFLLGLITWLGEALWPAAAWTQTLANRDAPAVAFAYDFLALLVILGVLMALWRRFVLRDSRLRTGPQDRLAIFLLGGLFLVGILAEAVRILSAGTPPEVAVYSFLGYGVAALLRPLGLTWTTVYPMVWYLHAWLAAAAIAYLPFSKFMHILVAPLLASLDTAREGSH